MIIATSIYLTLAALVCFLVWRFSGLATIFNLTMNFGHWLGIVIIIKTLFIDSQLYFINKTRRND